MYKILKLILPLLLVVSACKKESLPLNYLEGEWYYQYYNVHDAKIDGDPSKTVWEKTFEEPYTDGPSVFRQETLCLHVLQAAGVMAMNIP